MVSSVTEAGADVTLQALELGAVDFVTKPKIDVSAGLNAYAERLREKVRARVRVRPRSATQPTPQRLVRRPYRTTDQIIAIGASTGGTEAIRAVLEQMPADAPAIVITHHIPAAFSAPFAARLDRSSAMSVCEASDGQQILPGHAYVAPGDRHLLVERSGARYVCRLSDGPPQNRHRPSVEAMFDSPATHAGRHVVATILTGMGEDGD